MFEHEKGIKGLRNCLDCGGLRAVINRPGVWKAAACRCHVYVCVCVRVGVFCRGWALTPGERHFFATPHFNNHYHPLNDFDTCRHGAFFLGILLTGLQYPQTSPQQEETRRHGNRGSNCMKSLSSPPELVAQPLLTPCCSYPHLDSDTLRPPTKIKSCLWKVLKGKTQFAASATEIPGHAAHGATKHNAAQRNAAAWICLNAG